MRRFTLLSTALGALAATAVAASDASAAIRSFTIDNQLDDTCNIFVNGRFRAVVYPLSITPWILVGHANVPGRTNILLRCSDGGLYGTSVEATWNHCDFVLDEEGGGLHGDCY